MIEGYAFGDSLPQDLIEYSYGIRYKWMRFILDCIDEKEYPLEFSLQLSHDTLVERYQSSTIVEDGSIFHKRVLKRYMVAYDCFVYQLSECLEQLKSVNDMYPKLTSEKRHAYKQVFTTFKDSYHLDKPFGDFLDLLVNVYICEQFEHLVDDIPVLISKLYTLSSTHFVWTKQYLMTVTRRKAFSEILSKLHDKWTVPEYLDLKRSDVYDYIPTVLDTPDFLFNQMLKAYHKRYNENVWHHLSFRVDSKTGLILYLDEYLNPNLTDAEWNALVSKEPDADMILRSYSHLNKYLKNKSLFGIKVRLFAYQLMMWCMDQDSETALMNSISTIFEQPETRYLFKQLTAFLSDDELFRSYMLKGWSNLDDVMTIKDQLSGLMYQTIDSIQDALLEDVQSIN